MKVAVGPKEPDDFLVEALGLSVGLGMVPGRKAHVNLEHLEEGCPDSRGELGTPIGHDIFRQPVKPEHQVAEVFSRLQGSGEFGERNEATGFGKTVYHCEDGGVSIGGG